MKFEFSEQIFEKYLKPEISGKSVQWEPSCSMRTVRRDRENICSSQICELLYDGKLLI